MRFRKFSTRTIEVQSYVTLRSEWPATLADFVDQRYQARGHRVRGSRMEWQYFDTEDEARKWADAVHDENT